ncbi:MAG: hypothetical protein V4622_01380 [Bacteroidota bacterium]
MKKLLAILFLSINSFAQDTLSCKKDLTWEKWEKYYYKTSDESKQRYTGPAKCYPQKGVENRGFLKEGSWEGKVYGYKGYLLLGYSTFVNGFYDGLTIKYDENGNVKDSMIFEAGFEKYSKNIKRDKLDMICQVSEKIFTNDTLTLKIFQQIDDLPTKLNVEHYLKNKKNGSFEEYWIELDENKKLNYTIEKYSFYKDGILTCKRFFDGGIIYQEEQFENKKLSLKRTFYGDVNAVESEEHYVNGKIHGEKKYYDINGKISAIERFENGKSIEIIEY